jgi:integrase
MAWVRFPDGSRRKVERSNRADAERDLDSLLSEREAARSPRPRRERLATFNDVLDAWVAAGCPNVAVDKRSRRARPKSENTLDKIGYLLNGHVRPPLGTLRVERTDTARVAAVFQAMADAGYATSTIDHTWSYLHQACVYGVRNCRITVNPAADVLLPEARPTRKRKSFTIDQVRSLLLEAIPKDPRPAQWVTGLMCGLRPGELAGLRWPHVDIDGDDPHIVVAESGRFCPLGSVRVPATLVGSQSTRSGPSKADQQVGRFEADGLGAEVAVVTSVLGQLMVEVDAA